MPVDIYYAEPQWINGSGQGAKIYYKYSRPVTNSDPGAANGGTSQGGGDAYIYIDYKSTAGHNILTTITIKGKHGEVLNANDYLKDIKTFKFHSFRPSSGELTFDSKRRGTVQIVYEKDFKDAVDSQVYPTAPSQKNPTQPIQSNDSAGQGATSAIVVPVFTSSRIAADRDIKLLGGYPDGTLKPKSLVKREEVAAIFYKVLSEEYKAKSRDGAVSDVKSDSWAYESISTLVSGNIMPLKGDGKFYPKSNATRGDIAQILYALIQEDISEFDRPAYFYDVHSNTMGDAIGLVAAKGLMVGYKDGSFQPNKEVTRAELIVVINKLLGKNTAPTSDPTYFKDVNSTDWYYNDLQAVLKGK